MALPSGRLLFDLVYLFIGLGQGENFPGRKQPDEMAAMTKILIVETSAFWGDDIGGSFVQANFYLQFLHKHGFSTEIFHGDKTQGRFSNLGRLIRKIQEADCVVGFGTPLLGVYLQWLCVIYNKKGVFCVDTVLVYRNILRDQFHRRKFPLRLILESLWGSVHDKVLTAFPLPKRNLEILASCEYIKETLKGSFCEPLGERCLYTRVLVKEKKVKKKQSKTDSILFYGASFWGRGVLDLIKACKILWHRGYKFNLVILDRLAESFTRKILEREITGKEGANIFIYGKVKSPEKYVRQATAVVLPFRYPCSFQTPLTLLEPMFLGTPVVTTEVGSHSEWVKDSKTGIFCEGGNPCDMAQKIALILDNRIRAAEIAKNASALLRSRYSSPDVLLEILKKYQPDNYWAKRKYAHIDADQYEDERFRYPAGEMIDVVEKKSVLELLPDNKPVNILDVATGTGRLAFFLEKYSHAANIIGVDINNNMLIKARKSARENSSSVTFRRGDVYKLPFPGTQFNAVVGLRFSMHLPNLKTVFREFSRVLKDDGVLVFDIFNADSLLRFKASSGFYSLPDICRLAKDCGFQFQDCRGLVLFGETVLRVCPPKLLFLLTPLVKPPKPIDRLSTKLILSFRKKS